MFVHLIKRTKFSVRVRLFNKRANTNELPVEQFTNCSPNVWFVYIRMSYVTSEILLGMYACFIYTHTSSYLNCLFLK
ncbi:hypothetical protein Hanom_Chr12g01085661 [Helianthus anomalus]